MASNSAESVIEDAPGQEPRHHRARSSDCVDRLAEQGRRERYRYHDGGYSASSSSHQRSTSNRLCVPIIEAPVRRIRSYDATHHTDVSSPRDYSTQEIRPGPRPIYDVSSEPILPSQLPVKPEHKLKYHKRPSIKVQIHQDIPPSSSTPKHKTSRRSSNTSPRSPTARPLLHYQYEKLQDKLVQVCSACTPYMEVEAADPKDLTFAEIVARAEGFAFELRVWANTVGLNNLVKLDVERRNIGELAARSLDRLIERVADLRDACMRARPRDLKVEVIHDMDGGNLFLEDNSDTRRADPTIGVGFLIRSSLQSIELQLQGLRLLSSSLIEASPAARDDVIAVSRLAEDVARHVNLREAEGPHLGG